MINPDLILNPVFAKKSIPSNSLNTAATLLVPTPNLVRSPVDAYARHSMQASSEVWKLFQAFWNISVILFWSISVILVGGMFFRVFVTIFQAPGILNIVKIFC